MLLSLIFFNRQKIDFNDFALFGTLSIITVIYFVLGISDNLNSDKPLLDSTYLIFQLIKFFLGILLIATFINLFQDENDMRLFIKSAAVLITPVIFYLSWKYLIIYEKDDIGVVVDDALSGMKTYKNSLATSLALFTPFFISCLKTESKTELFIYSLAIFSCCFFFYYVNSRSAILIFVIELLVLYLFAKSKKIKKMVNIFSILTITILISLGFSTSDWFKKSGAYSDSGFNLIVTKTFFETHRGELLIEASKGIIDSGGIGNGIATFRIRDSNQGHRTDSHNDYALILYEQGIIGLFFYLLIIFNRLYFSWVELSRSSNRYLEASFASIVGLSFSLIFINLVYTSIFWAIIGINYAISYRLSRFSIKN